MLIPPPACTPRSARILAYDLAAEIRACLQEWAFELALGLSVIAQIFNPRQIIIGGGIMHQRQLYPMIAKQLNKLIYPSLKPIKLLQAELLNQAGLMGAAYLAKEKFSLD